MKISIQKNDVIDVRADVLVVNLFQGVTKPSGATGVVDAALGGALSREIAELKFEGKLGEMLTLSTLGTLPATRVVVVGLGPKQSFDAEAVRRVSGAVICRFRNTGVQKIVTVLHGAGMGGLSAAVAAQALAEGAWLANYQFHKHRTPPKNEKAKLAELVIIEQDAAKVRQASPAIALARTAVVGVELARDLVNEPASIAVPKHLVEHAKEIAALAPKRITLSVLDRAACAKKGMGAFLAVASGAGEEPYFIHLVYTPAKKSKKTVAIVGKGVTFDSGGLQIKPDHAMSTMKLDMAGAAAVLGLFRVLAERGSDVTVHGIIAATENMPGPGAYKPGDVVRAMNGKTIEIGHTDAEGRVTLADSLSYAAALKPDMIVDLATLTGAAMVALGEEVTALMTNNVKLGERVKRAAAEAGERVWELPLVPEYRDLIKGTFGDVANSSSVRYGGAITAGLFLQEFVSDLPWVHLDIAGPAWAERENISYMPKGGTGFGVRTLLAFLAHL